MPDDPKIPANSPDDAPLTGLDWLRRAVGEPPAEQPLAGKPGAPAPGQGAPLVPGRRRQAARAPVETHATSNSSHSSQDQPNEAAQPGKRAGGKLGGPAAGHAAGPVGADREGRGSRAAGKQVGGAVGKQAGKQAGKQLGSAAGASVAGPAGAAVGRVTGGTVGKLAGKVAGARLGKQLAGGGQGGAGGGVAPRVPGAPGAPRSRAPIGRGGGGGNGRGSGALPGMPGMPGGFGPGRRGDPRGQIKQVVKQQAKRRLLQILIPLVIKLFFWMTVVGALVAIVFTLMSPFLWAFRVWHWGSSLKKEITSLVQTKSGDKTLQELLTQELDCRNASPADQKAGLCIRQDFTEASPVPPSAEWLVPVWEAAGSKYQVPWQLLAAIAGARTNFGDENCIGPGTDPPSVGGEGFYRMPSDSWLANREDAGQASNDKATADSTIVQNARCFTSSDPSPKKWAKKDGHANAYDAVDATFSLAKELHQGQTNISSAAGASDPEGPDWSDYAGSDSGACTPLTSNDGPVYRWSPDSGFVGGGGGGWNEKLQLPQDILALGARYTPVRNNGKLTDQSFFAPYSNAHPVEGEDSPMTIPDDDVEQIITAVGHALLLPDDVIAQVRPGLMARMKQESGYRPGAVNRKDSNAQKGYTWESRGIFQFIPPTFSTWHVPGFNNIFNPVDNILAAMNSMLHSDGPVQGSLTITVPGYGFWAQGGVAGWGPQGSNNPYAGTQGKELDSGSFNSAAGDGSSSDLVSVKKNATDYSGSDPNDPISKALIADFAVPGHKPSPCFVAIVHDWYQAISEHPPETVAGADGSLAKMINVAKAAETEHIQEISYTDDNGNTWPGPNQNHGPIVDKYLAAVGITPDMGNGDPSKQRPWCAAFVSWSAQQAGVKIGPDGNGSASVKVLTDWAISLNIWSPVGRGGPPAPGDLVAFGNNEHIGIVVANYPDHFLTIEGNATNTVEYVPRYPSRDNIMGYIRLTKMYGNAGGGFVPPQHLKGNQDPSTS